MSLRMKNRDNVPATPKSWTAPSGHRIRWDSVRETWETFVNKVMSYADANSVSRPALDALEDLICRQMASWACIGSREYAANQSPPKAAPNYTRTCGACGGGKRK
jgi:hypothetical protein